MTEVNEKNRVLDILRRTVTCDNCGVWGYWLSNREDDLPPGHEGDTILCGGDASGLRPDRPYCDDCQMATQMATQTEPPPACGTDGAMSTPDVDALVAKWRQGAVDLRASAERLRSSRGPLRGPEGAEDIEAAALDYQLEADALEAAGSIAAYNRARALRATDDCQMATQMATQR